MNLDELEKLVKENNNAIALISNYDLLKLIAVARAAITLNWAHTNFDEALKDLEGE